MSTKETVKAQIQSLINLANTTTGNTDTNLTDGVNALVSGYGQGGIQLPEDMLEGLENGYDVMFYDEFYKGLAFYSVKQGHAIHPPVYNCKNWQDANGGVITFPYTPTSDAIFYALNSTYADQLYEFYGIDKGVYPYLTIMFESSKYLNIYFSKGITTLTETNMVISDYKTSYTNGASSVASLLTNIEALVSKTMELLPSIQRTDTGTTGMSASASKHIYTNYNTDGYLIAMGGKYRLDQ